MARFYKTAKGEFVENAMYQPPIELMAKVIGNADQQILQNETALASLYDKLQAQGLAVDNPRLQEIMGGFKSQIDEMASKIQENPLEFRRETGNIRNLGKSIADNWNNGEVSVIQNNKAIRDKFVKDYLERVKSKDGRVLQQDVNNAINLFDKTYKDKGGANYKGTGDYNQFYTEDLNPYVDINELGESVGKGWQADMSNQGYAYTDGQWIREGTNGKEVADEKQIRQAIQTRILNDPEAVAYYQQQLKFGALTPEQLAKKIQDTADVYAEKYGYVKQTSTSKMDANPYAMENLRNQNDIDKMYLKQKLDKEMEDYKSNIANVKEIGTSSTTTFLTADQMKAYNEYYIDEMNEIAGDIQSPAVTRESIRETLHQLGLTAKRDGNTKQIEALKGYWDRLNYAGSVMNKSQGEASWASGIKFLGSDVIVSAKKDFENVLKDPGQLYGKKMTYKINGKTFNTTMNDIYNNPKKYKLPEDAFTVDMEKLEMKDIYNQGSIRPMFTSSSNNKLNTMNFNFNINGATIEANTDFTNLGIATGN